MPIAEIRMGGAEWDFWDAADWEWVVETICFYPIPMEAEPFQRADILDTGESTSVTSASWVKQWDSEFRRKLSIGDKTFRFGPGKPVPSLGTYALKVSITGTNAQKDKQMANFSFLVDVVGVVIPLLLSRL